MTSRRKAKRKLDQWTKYYCHYCTFSGGIPRSLVLTNGFRRAWQAYWKATNG